MSDLEVVPAVTTRRDAALGTRTLSGWVAWIDADLI